MDDIIIEDNLEDEVESWEPNFWERLFSNKMAVFGATVILILFITAIFAPLIAPYPYDAIDLPKSPFTKLLK